MAQTPEQINIDNTQIMMPMFHFTLVSDHIPLDIQSEIIKRLPVKSVIQCRSASKQWKSLIDSSNFIKTYQTCKTHLFVKYRSLASELKFVSIMDDDTFPNQISSLTVPQPVSLVLLIYTLASANGLLCSYGLRECVTDERIAILWNPCVKKVISIPISNPLQYPDGRTYAGFGVCPNTSDPKMVRINTIGCPTVNREVEVFTLITRVWNRVYNIPTALTTCDLTYDPVFVDGVIYWPAYHNTHLIAIRPSLIISFDLKSYEFGEVCLPDRLNRMNGLLSKVYESLGFFDYYNDGETKFCDVWMMKEGVTKSFSKMLSIKVPHRVSNRVLQLSKNGQVIIETTDDTSSSMLEVYEPSSGRIDGVGLNGRFRSFSLNSYMETLLLLDEPNSIIH